MTPPSRALFLAGRDALHPGAAGGDLQAWQWATHLAAAGWHVEFVCQSGDGLSERQTASGVSILRLGSGPLLAIRAARHYRRHKSEIDIIYEDPIGAGRTPFLSPLYARVGVIAVWHQVSADLLATLHGSGVAAVLSFLERLVARFYRRAFLWAPSWERADEISRDLRIPRDRITVIPPTLATGIQIRATTVEAGPQILCLGVMRSYKHFDHVIRTMPAILAVIPSARLVIAGRRGSDAFESTLLGVSTALGLDEVVDFRFDLTDDDRQALIRQSALLVIPSLLEGFGIVSIEANAEGVPVVASSGVPVAAVEHDLNGLRYPFGDLAALTHHIQRILQEPALRRRLGQTGLAHARALTTAGIAPRFDRLVARAQAQSRPTGSRRGLVAKS
ncbi:glycosyltransferase family 4 protein [Cryobacterium sp. Y82]|uniref:glycosyltransferase family 4 protein n=1 Tax=Cryobacterium sp. Y82 TaxID=2045017 RepID=UPI000CE31560|nr:glycosyltransferase family 4 protein [Cryobacterium sp. Y82]